MKLKRNIMILIFIVLSNYNIFSNKQSKRKISRAQAQEIIVKNNLFIKQALCLTKNIKYKSDTIPLNVFHTYETQLNSYIAKSYEKLKLQNQEFNFYFYDDSMRREFIKDNFEKDVVDAYDSLLPGAFKADLWRYCILYKKGGIYMDIKFTLSDNSKYKLIDLIDREYYVRDSFELDKGRKLTKYEGEFIAQGFLVSKKNNKIMLKCIEKIVSNCKNKDISEGLLGVTGPALIAQVIHDNIELCKYADLQSLKNILTGISYKNKPFLNKDVKAYKSYKGVNKKDYAVLWPNIYTL